MARLIEKKNKDLTVAVHDYGTYPVVVEFAHTMPLSLTKEESVRLHATLGEVLQELYPPQEAVTSNPPSGEL